MRKVTRQAMRLDARSLTHMVPHGATPPTLHNCVRLPDQPELLTKSLFILRAFAPLGERKKKGYAYLLEFAMKEYRDHYFLKAKRENYPARSVYKLKELDAKFHLLRPGQRVLDLGAAPGSWSLGAAEKVGPRGLVLACDIQSTETAFPPQVTFMQENVFNRSDAFEAKLADVGPFDIVISDMAPRTTGTRFTDQARSLELTIEALAVACLHLKKGGSFVVKIFMGPDIQVLLAPMRKAFGSVKSFKPKSSRAESKETFFVGLGFRGQADAALLGRTPGAADGEVSAEAADDAPPGA